MSKFPKSARTQTAVWFRGGLAVVALTTAAGVSGGRLLTACSGCLLPMADCSGGLPPLLSAANGSGGGTLDDGEI